MEDMAAAVEAKEQAHAQEMIDLERKLLTDKGNLQKVIQMYNDTSSRGEGVDTQNSETVSGLVLH